MQKTDEGELFYYFTPCLKPDSDGDGRIDSLEYLEGTSPYEYDKKWYEHTWDFICGFVAGDFIAETDSMAVVAGQILSSCIPYVDIRDVAGNLVNGDYMFAGLSALGLVPIAGDTAKAVSKIGKFAIKNLDNVAKVADVVEFTSKYYPDAVKLLAKNDDFVSAAKAMSNNTSLKMTKKDAERINKILEDAGLSEYVIKRGVDVIVTVGKTNPFNLQPTHSPTLSKNQLNALIDDIKINGIQETIKYVEYNGQKYVVDRHHRLLAAKRLGLTEVPIEKVNLPYAGYNTIDDLLWYE